MSAYPPSAPFGPDSAAPSERCAQLFAGYPMAAAGCPRSMILMARGAAPAFFVLTEVGGSLFRICRWNCRDESQVVAPAAPVSDVFAGALADAMPLPRDGAVLGWVAGRQVTAIMTVHSGPRVGGCAPAAAPEIRVMPMSGTGPLDWPPFAACPLGDGRLWDYAERGEIVDLAPLLAGHPGQAFRVPCPPGQRTRRGTAYVVVTALVHDEYWLPAGVYTDHWMLREGIPAPPAAQLLGLPDTVDLAREPGAADSGSARPVT